MVSLQGLKVHQRVVHESIDDIELWLTPQLARLVTPRVPASQGTRRTPAYPALHAPVPATPAGSPAADSQ